MVLLQQLKARLVFSKIISEEQAKKAEQYAAKEGISLDDALVMLQFAQYPQIGQCLSEVTEMPYSPLLNKTFSSRLISVFSKAWAAHWTVFPVSYDQSSQILTIALSDPAIAPKIQGLYKFFMEQSTLFFTVAPFSEVRKSIELHYGITSGKENGKTEPPRQLLKLPSAKTAKTPAPGEPKMRLPSLSGRPSRQASPPGPPIPADEVGKYLISAAALLIEASLGDNTSELHETRARVRYCQLLATRLNLPQDQINKVVVAAWLSGLAAKPNTVRQFLTPYNLEEIILSKESNKAKPSPERLILELVSRYQDMRKREPSASPEVNLIRRNLHVVWSSAQSDQPMLETFLQILMDEQFLSKVNRSAGRILVLENFEVSHTSVAPPLNSDGYDVRLVPTVEAAVDCLKERIPDLVISDLSLPKDSGLVLCQRLRTEPSTAQIPMLMLIRREEEKRAAECLRAGVDDFLPRPVDMELLFLKTHKLMRTTPAEPSQSGVTGKLEDMSFTDMIQILSAGNRNMEVQLNSRDQEGKVFLKEGNVIHAVIGKTEGEAAFYEFMKWREGNFGTKPCSEFPATTIQASTTSLLMEGARIADEIAADKA